MTSFPQPASTTSNFTAVYDAWNRMVSISDTGGTVATYQYDGRNFRIVKYTASIPETRHFYYTSQWQDIEERVGTSTSMDKQYVWPALSMVEGGSAYIDQLICRDDATPQRLYACQDANFNLTAITDTGGSIVERYVFDPYGVRTIMNPSWGMLSVSAYDWVIGHQGLMIDTEGGLIYGRMRYMNPGLGRWVQRDPKSYVDGPNLYMAEHDNPINLLDPQGTVGGYVPPPHSPGNGTPCCIKSMPYWQYWGFPSFGDCFSATWAANNGLVPWQYKAICAGFGVAKYFGVGANAGYWVCGPYVFWVGGGAAGSALLCGNSVCISEGYYCRGICIPKGTCCH